MLCYVHQLSASSAGLFGAGQLMCSGTVELFLWEQPPAVAENDTE